MPSPTGLPSSLGSFQSTAHPTQSWQSPLDGQVQVPLSTTVLPLTVRSRVVAAGAAMTVAAVEKAIRAAASSAMALKAELVGIV
jgi:hypothetical protein